MITMAELYREEIVRVSLGDPLRMYSVGKVLATGDDRANRFGASVFKRGAVVSLSGAKVTGYFTPPVGDTMLLDGSASGNTAYVDLHAACYAQEGRFSLAVKATSDGVTTTLCVFDGWIITTATDDVRDPGGIVPSLDDVLEKISAMEQATAAANEAAQTAAGAAADLLTSAAVPVSNDVAASRISTQDSADGRPLAGLSILGRTTQDGTPSPDAPAALESVENPTVCIVGKNQFDKNKVRIIKDKFINSSGVLENNTEYAYTDTYIPVMPATGYALSGKIVLIVYNTVAFYDAEKRFISRFSPGVQGKNAVFTTPANCYYIRFNAAVREEHFDVNTIQLEIGSAETAYEPCSAQYVTADADLHGIPVASGGSYTDESGQQWLCDEIDLARGVYVQRIVRKRMQNLQQYSISGTTGLAIGYDSTLAGPFVSGAGMSNALPLRTADQQFSSDASCLAAHASRGPLVQIAGCKTLDTLNTYLASNEIIVQVALSEPVETPIPAETVNAFNQLRSIYGHMNVLSDTSAGLNVSYVADTKLYIDQKMAAIAQAVLNL